MQGEETVTKVVTLPLFCPEGHQIYVTHFPQVNMFGFACAMCHRFGTVINHGTKVLEIAEVDSPRREWGKDIDELLMGLELKAIHQQDLKGHNLMCFEFTKGFGIGCIHCKVYSLTFTFQERVYGIRVLRELAPSDPKVNMLERKPVLEDPSFTLPN